MIFFLTTYSALPAQPYETLAAELLENVRKKADIQSTQRQLAQINPDELAQQLDTDAKKKAFWINIYNSYVITALQKQPELYADRGKFFGRPRVSIAGLELSLDQIEHGIIRRSQIKLGLGFLGKLFPDKYEKKFRVETVDPRVHFALNCGAESCPPVEIFQAETIDQQLDRRTKFYLADHTTYLEAENKVIMTPLVSWFRGDFGGLSGVKKMLRKQGIIPEDANPSLDFEPYDWTLDIDNFAAATR